MSTRLTPPLAAYYCHSCGRHTSSRGTPSHLKSPESTGTGTPPKYCSQRCKSDGRPSSLVALAWQRMLDGQTIIGPGVQGKEGEEGKVKPGKRDVLCSTVQAALFDETTGQPRDDTVQAMIPDTQVLGMQNAANREMIRRSARLLYHFGFSHFTLGKARVSHLQGFDMTEEARAVEVLGEEEREVQAVDAKGKVVDDVTHAKGEWGLRWKR